jgi:NADH:ubiquinone oxidoreductase subunit 6 (subunit J)
MMTRLGATGEPDKLTGPQAPFAALVSVTLLLTLVGVSLTTAWPGDVDDLPTNITIEQIGDIMFTSYGAPFIIASALLLVAFIGAIVFARQEEDA